MKRQSGIDLLGASLLVGFSVLLGLNQALVKLVNQGFAPLFQSGLRSAVAFVPVFAFALIMKRRLSISDGSLGWGTLNGLFFCLEFGLLFVALDYTTVARVSLFFYAMPVWVAIGAHFLIPEEPMNRNKAMGLLLSMAGMGVALASNWGEAGTQGWMGDLMALIAGVFWACIALLTKTKLSGVTAEMNLLYQLAISAIVLCAVAPFVEPVIREPSMSIYAIFAFQAIVIVAVGFLAWFWLLSVYPVSNMSSFGLLSPVFGVFFGWLIFDDSLTPGFLAALAAVGAGIVLVNKPARSP